MYIYVNKSYLYFQRANCTEALKMPYFSNKPYPSNEQNLPLPSTLAKKVMDKPNKRKLLDSESNQFAKKLVF